MLHNPYQTQIYFNPRSDERSDSDCIFTERLPYISIHAPTNGATKYNHIQITFRRISIHAPTNGATPCLLCESVQHRFQSTLRRTERQYTICYCFSKEVFQSTLRRTERQYTICYCFSKEVFQSTLRRTERL